ncbi:acyltransferase family protein [Bradyrhizobium sp.]|uniref:acyltransferase family protein n=1 Tax=Bradyrhizobium sp. TaxID=376 RepID=UPI003C438239
MEQRRFYPELESLRGLAAFAVLGEHSFLRFQGEGLTRFLDVDGPWSGHPSWVVDWLAVTIFPGAAAVSLFFVLSGFVLGETLRLGADSRYQTYAVRRLFRIMPALWASVLTAAAIWATLVRPIGPLVIAHHFWLSETWLNVPLWSLRVELIMSALLPLLLWACERMATTARLVTLVCLIGLSARDFGVPGIGFAYAFWLGLLVPSLGRMVIEAFDHRTLRRLLVGAVLLLCLSRTLAIASGHHVDRLIAAFPSFFVVAYLSYGSFGRLRRLMLSNAARALGRISYSFYLFHYPILDLISLAMIGAFGAAYWQAYPIVGQLVLFALAAPTTFLVASFAYRAIEAPGIAVGKWWLTRFSVRQTHRLEQSSRAD